MVWNGQELGGGTIRIHRADVQQQVFAVLGIDAETGRGAFRLPARGAALRRPAARRHRLRHRPHRPLLSGAETIRDVIAFPKTASGSTC